MSRKSETRPIRGRKKRTDETRAARMAESVQRQGSEAERPSAGGRRRPETQNRTNDTENGRDPVDQQGDDAVQKHRHPQGGHGASRGPEEGVEARGDSRAHRAQLHHKAAEESNDAGVVEAEAQVDPIEIAVRTAADQPLLPPTARSDHLQRYGLILVVGVIDFLEFIDFLDQMVLRQFGFGAGRWSKGGPVRPRFAGGRPGRNAAELGAGRAGRHCSSVGVARREHVFAGRTANERHGLGFPSSLRAGRHDPAATVGRRSQCGRRHYTGGRGRRSRLPLSYRSHSTYKSHRTHMTNRDMTRMYRLLQPSARYATKWKDRPFLSSRKLPALSVAVVLTTARLLQLVF